MDALGWNESWHKFPTTMKFLIKLSEGDIEDILEEFGWKDK